jgi:hypothetical protein
MMGRIKMGLRIPQKGMEYGDPRRGAKGHVRRCGHDEEMIQGSHKETIGI